MGALTIALPDTSIIDRLDIRFSAAWIVVEQTSPDQTRRRSSTSPVSLEVNGENTYITARLPLEEAHATFIIGDGQEYGGFKNKKRAAGHYNIYISYQAVTEQTVTQFYQLNSDLVQGWLMVICMYVRVYLV